MQIEEPVTPGAGKWVPFALGFRPFFFLAAMSAIILLLVWLVMFGRGTSLNIYYPAVYWHAHEMMFGYGVAVISGFLLTAVRNWTDLPVPSGKTLAALVLLWLAGRFAPFLSPLLPAFLIAAVDLALLPLLAWIIGIRVWKRKQYSNLVFSGVLLGMFSANLLMHLEFSGFIQDSAWYGQVGMLFLLMLIIVVMGGRVIPFFAERGVGISTRKWAVIEFLAPLSIAMLAFATLFADDVYNSWLALFAFLVHLIRLTGWYRNAIWKEPLVWVLIVGYAWLVLSLGMMFLAFVGLFPTNLAWHAFTVGALGGITLGMMARVSLGHTGREMKLPGKMAIAFVLLNIATLLRVIVPLLSIGSYTALVNISGVIWLLAFGLFVFYFTPMLLSARVDGRPG